MGLEQHEELLTEGQAINWINSLVATAEQCRMDCGVEFPEDKERTVAHQKSAFRKLMIHYGIALGALTALAHCRKISPAGFDKMKQRVRDVMIPKVVGRA